MLTSRILRAGYSVTAIVVATLGLTACGGGDGSGSTNSSVPSSSSTSYSSVTLSWAAPALNTDGSQLTDLSGYRVKYGRESSNLSQSELITDPSVTSYEVKYLTTGTWYFSMVAINSAGEESDQSNTVSKTVS